MISENKMKHQLAVARRCKEVASLLNLKNTENYFLMGYLHDVGYEFQETPKGHAETSYNLCKNFGILDNNYIEAIKNHGKYIPLKDITIEYAVLVYSDLTTNHIGEYVSIDERIEGIKERYGENSTQYDIAVKQKKEIYQYFLKYFKNNNRFFLNFDIFCNSKTIIKV